MVLDRATANYVGSRGVYVSYGEPSKNKKEEKV